MPLNDSTATFSSAYGFSLILILTASPADRRRRMPGSKPRLKQIRS